MDLRFKDKWNCTIRLTKERIKHISYHMELHNKLHIIEEVLSYPDLVCENEEQEGTWYYQKYLREEAPYFIVIVKKNEQEGFIITIFKSKKLKE